MKFVAFERNTQGTGASRRLRRAGKAPGIVYGGEQPPQLIELDHNALWHALRNDAFHSSVLAMELGGKTTQVLLRDLQVHPYKQQVLHVDFQRVSAKEAITIRVPLHYFGEEESEAVKVDKCLINQVATELEISCLPADLPENIPVDLSKLEKGDTITLAEITLPEGVEAVLRGLEPEDIVLVTVADPVLIVEEDTVDEGAEPTEGEAQDEAKDEGEDAES